MSHFSIQGHAIPGHLYELKSDVKQAAERGHNDGLDQVYFRAGDKNYLLEGDGLELSSLQSNLKNGHVPQAELHLSTQAGEQALPAEILQVDNEVNTAREGLGHMGHLIGAALVGSALSGGALIWKSSQALSAQTRTLVAQSETLGQAVGQVAHLKALPLSFTEGLSPGLLSGMKEGLAKELLQKQAPKGISTSFKTSHAIVLDKGLKKVESGLSQSEGALSAARTSTAEASQQVSKIHFGLKVVAAGVALAGTVAVGAALYGAYRGEDSEALNSLKGKEIH